MGRGNPVRVFQALALAAAAALGCATACFGDGSCEDGGRTFSEGSIWTCSDGCNTCSCHDATVTSTLIGCASPAGPAAGKLKCWTGTYWETHGNRWSCNDDACAECSCNDGHVARTMICGESGNGSGG